MVHDHLDKRESARAAAERETTGAPAARTGNSGVSGRRKTRLRLLSPLRAAVVLALALALAGAAGGVAFFYPQRSRAELLLEARRALRSGDYAPAERIANDVLADEPQDVPALLVAGEAATRQDELEQALEYYRRVPDVGSKDAFKAFVAAGSVAYELGRLTEAERFYHRSREYFPHHPEVNRRLAIMLNIEGRRWEAVPYLFELVRNGQFSIEELLLLGNAEEPYSDVPVIEKALEAAPDDPLPLLGKAQMVMIENRPQRAIALLERVVKARPNLAAAQAELGNALLETEADEELLAWAQSLPEPARRSGLVWSVLGHLALQRDNRAGAVRCFWEAVRREPNHRRANYQCGQVLMELGKKRQAEAFLDRANLLSQLHNTLHPVYFEGPRITSMERAVRLLESLGRPWEAWAWCVAILHHDADNEFARTTRDRLRAYLDETSPPQTLAEANPARKHDLSEYPLPDWDRAPSESRSERRFAVDRNDAGFRFADVGREVGLQFSYYNGQPPGRVGKHMHETTGGGVAVTDFDRDGRPDLYFTQGTDWPPRDDNRRYRDAFFRNLAGGDGFTGVSRAAGLGDVRFSQGATVGDYNGDGFPDLYVGNIGVNRLYRNNGDGTFTETGVQGGLTDASWTTSCVLADLNGDGLPDLYDVNYLRGEEVFERLCGAKIARSCAPSQFAGQQDRAFLNRGDGTWTEATGEWGLDGLRGKGLGIVAADFGLTGKLSLFIANDGVANFFLVDDESPVVRYSDDALLRGLAFDRDGRAQACMGVATDDIDHDGRMDLFVTNFYDDSNTLYRQRAGGFFADETRTFGLRDPSYHMLGFGTEFLDADLDGRRDLVVTNGHIDDFSHDNKPYRMPPQLFRRTADGFAEVPRETLGGFFTGTYLGRGLATLDWNGDGREDFAVSHLDSPAALVTNRATEAGHSIVFTLAGTESARDAIGAAVQVTAGGREYSRQLIAGDGYQSSNQRHLVFGLGEARSVEGVRVRWPSGTVQEFGRLSAGHRYQLVEGRDDAFRVPGSFERPSG